VTYLINSDFFVDGLDIPNTGKDDVKVRLDGFIAQYEVECLRNILGYPLYKAFNDEIQAGTYSTRFQNLLDGSDFTVDGKLKNWQGLVRSQDNNDDPPVPLIRISLIANYIYWFWTDDAATKSTGVGATGKMNVQAGISVTPADKMVKAWKFFSQQTSDMVYFLWNKKDEAGNRVYPEFEHHDVSRVLNFSRVTNLQGF
jgi:hypothetical protein